MGKIKQLLIAAQEGDPKAQKQVARLSGQPEIDPKDWKWCGFPGHFSAARWCRFHLTTRVGDILISTLGDYHPGGQKKAETLGAWEDSFYEVLVCPTVDSDVCSVGSPDVDNTLLQEEFLTPEEAEKKHMELCHYYARNHGRPDDLRQD